MEAIQLLSIGLAAALFLPAGAWAWTVLSPSSSARFLLKPLIRAVYRIRVRGAEHVPAAGGALLACNHVSFVDALLVGASLRRPVRFLMQRELLRLRVLGSAARALGAIPISASDGVGALREALKRAAERARAGELVCIFGEGAVTRTGALQAFGRGLEVVAREAEVPIVPVCLDQVWGSIFSFQGGRAIWKRPRLARFPVGLEFGRPLEPGASGWQVQQEIQVLSASAARRRLEAQGAHLGRRFLSAAAAHRRRRAVVDSSGTTLSYGRLLAAALALVSELRRELEGEERGTGRVGVLLPPGAAGALALVSLGLLDRSCVPLNYALAPEGVAELCRRAGLRHVIASRRFLEHLGWSEAFAGGARVLCVEDLLARIRRGARLRAGLLARLPAGLLARRLALRSGGEAAVVFSSGSTAEPKGVVLSHANVASNAEAMAQVFRLSPQDTMLGVLPFFHSFGLTASLWAPLLSGASAAFHGNPLDPRAIGKLAREARATIVLATPTFCQAWMRRLEREDLASVRLCVVGAQKLSATLAEAWRERFGLDLLEGYGCTELSPCVAVNVPDVELMGVRQKGQKRGTVGRPLPGVAVRVVAGESRVPCAPGVEGRLQVRGPNVMLGYLDDPRRTAEVLEDGWYDTGDVAVVDEQGFLSITDRLARFSKIGGEMVSHGRVEEALLAALARGRESGASLPELAVVGLADESRGERLAVVHTALGASVEVLLQQVRSQGLPNLFLPRADAFVEVGELGKLGSGKLDLKAIRALAERRLAPAARA